MAEGGDDFSRSRPGKEVPGRTPSMSDEPVAPARKRKKDASNSVSEFVGSRNQNQNEGRNPQGRGRGTILEVNHGSASSRTPTTQPIYPSLDSMQRYSEDGRQHDVESQGGSDANLYQSLPKSGHEDSHKQLPTGSGNTQQRGLQDQASCYMKLPTSFPRAIKTLQVELRCSGRKFKATEMISTAGPNFMKPCAAHFGFSLLEMKQRLNDKKFPVNKISVTQDKVTLDVGESMVSDDADVASIVDNMLKYAIAPCVTSKLILYGTEAYGKLMENNQEVIKLQERGGMQVYVRSCSGPVEHVYIVADTALLDEVLRCIGYTNEDVLTTTEIAADRWHIVAGLRLPQRLEEIKPSVLLHESDDKARVYGTKEAIQQANKIIDTMWTALTVHKVSFETPQCGALLQDDTGVNRNLKIYFQNKLREKKSSCYADIDNGECCVYGLSEQACQEGALVIRSLIGSYESTYRRMKVCEEVISSWGKKDKLKIIYRNEKKDVFQYVCTMEAHKDIESSMSVYTESIYLSDVVLKFLRKYCSVAWTTLSEKHEVKLQKEKRTKVLTVIGSPENIEAFKSELRTLYCVDSVYCRAGLSTVQQAVAPIQQMMDSKQCCHKLTYPEIATEHDVGDCMLTATWQHLTDTGSLALVLGDTSDITVGCVIVLITDDFTPLTPGANQDLDNIKKEKKMQRSGKQFEVGYMFPGSSNKNSQTVYVVAWQESQNKNTALSHLLCTVIKKFKSSCESFALSVPQGNNHFSFQDIGSAAVDITMVYPEIKFYLCTTSDSQAQQMVDAIEDVYQRQRPQRTERSHGFYRMKYSEKLTIHNEFHAIKIKLDSGSLVDFKMDALVNTVDKKLQLDSGAVSKMLLQHAGKEIQDSVLQQKPDGLSAGEYVTTHAGQLSDKGVKYIIHANLPSYNKRFFIKSIKEMVKRCLVEADNRRCSSIAFPAFGTGKLGYPAHETAKAMFEAVEEYQHQGINSSLETVLFVVYAMQVSQIFLEEEAKRGKADIELFDRSVKEFPFLYKGNSNFTLVRVIDKPLVDMFLPNVCRVFLLMSDKTGVEHKDKGEVIIQIAGMKSFKSVFVAFLQNSPVDMVIHLLPETDAPLAKQITEISDVVKNLTLADAKHLRYIFIAYQGPSSLDEINKSLAGFFSSDWKKHEGVDGLIGVTVVSHRKEVAASVTSHVRTFIEPRQELQQSIEDAVEMADEATTTSMLESDDTMQAQGLVTGRPMEMADHHFGQSHDAASNTQTDQSDQAVSMVTPADLAATQVFKFKASAIVNGGIVKYLRQHQRLESWKRKVEHHFRLIMQAKQDGEITVTAEFDDILAFEKYLENVFPKDPTPEKQDMGKLQSVDSTFVVTVNSDNSGMYGSWKVGNVRLSVVQDDITTRCVDCLVSPCADTFKGSQGSVAKCIEEKAGRTYTAACAEEFSKNGELEYKECRPTGAGALPCKLVLNTRGPDNCSSTENKKLDIILQATLNCLETAAAFGYNSLALPAIGAGVRKLNVTQSAQQVYRAVKQVQQSTLEDVELVLFSKQDAHEVAAELKKLVANDQAGICQTTIKPGPVKCGQFSVHISLGKLEEAKLAAVVSCEDDSAYTVSDISKRVSVCGDEAYERYRSRLLKDNKGYRTYPVQVSMNFRYVIHTLVSRWNGDMMTKPDIKQHEVFIAKAVSQAVRDAEDCQCESLAMSLFGESVDEARYSTPVRRCCFAMITGLAQAYKQMISYVKHIHFITPDKEHARTFSDMLQQSDLIK